MVAATVAGMPTQGQSDASSDRALQSLEGLLSAASEVSALLGQLEERAAFIRRGRATGLPWHAIVPNEERPLIVEITAQAIALLSSASAEFRRNEARALYQEGLTMDDIAASFLVTRQRVSSLLRREKKTERGRAEEPVN